MKVADQRDADKLLYTPSDAADALSVSRATVYRLMANGRLASLAIGTARRIPSSALHEFIQTELTNGVSPSE